jgi:hypothetical protein
MLSRADTIWAEGEIVSRADTIWAAGEIVFFLFISFLSFPFLSSFSFRFASFLFYSPLSYLLLFFFSFPLFFFISSLSLSIVTFSLSYRCVCRLLCLVCLLLLLSTHLPVLFSFYRYTFNHVFGPKSSQQVHPTPYNLHPKPLHPTPYTLTLLPTP